jgi:urease accessory protein
MHDPEGKDRPFSSYQSECRIERPDGSLLALDRTGLVSPFRGGGARAGYAAFGTLMVAVRRPAAWVEALCAGIDARLARLPNVYAATSALPNEAGVSVRIAAHDGRHLRLGLQTGWCAVRPHLGSCVTAQPRNKAVG